MAEQIQNVGRRRPLTPMVALFAAAALYAAPLRATPLVGDVMLTAANYCPVGWAEADGSLLPISEYDTLFAVIGTTYGGDGQETFALPDLRGRLPVGTGQGSGLNAVQGGQTRGQEQVTTRLTAVGTGPYRGQSVIGDPLSITVRTVPPELGLRYCISLFGIFPAQG
ncbi:MAG: tail fiber protein [Geminicoccaceae bacterium]